jgi:ATP-binding cassette subfamily C protein
MNRADPSRSAESGVAALLSDYRKFAGARLWLALALMLSGAVAEAFGLLMIVPLATIATGSSSASLGRFTGWADNFPADQRLLIVLALFIGAMGLRSLLLYARDVELARLEADYVASLRLRSAATLARKGWSFASRIGQAGMQSLLLNDVPRAGLAINHVQALLVAAVMLAVQLTLAAILSPKLTLVALLILVAGALLSVSWMRRGVESGMALSETAEDSTSSGFRLHAGLKAALAQGTVHPFLDEYRTSLAGVTDRNVQFTRDFSAARQMGALGAALAAALLLFVGVQVLALPFPVLIASLVLFARMSAPAQGLQQSAQLVAAHAAAFTAIEQRLGPLGPPAAAAPSARPLEWRELRLDGVAFEHQPSLGLPATSLRLKRGEWIGLAGVSGAGKTTLVDLVVGLLSPEAGTISADGRPLGGERLEQWRAGLAYVGQDGAVFNDSVRGNLLAEGAAADEDALWRALDLAGLATRVRAFPQGLDESVGDRGSVLSGGERQRLVLARALLRNPTLLILDEATAALDAKGEAQLLKRLRALKPRPAAIVIAHRESTLRHCDSVIELQHDGREKAAH